MEFRELTGVLTMRMFLYVLSGIELRGPGLAVLEQGAGADDERAEEVGSDTLAGELAVHGRDALQRSHGLLCCGHISVLDGVGTNDQQLLSSCCRQPGLRFLLLQINTHFGLLRLKGVCIEIE